ncbi:hypothetical protein CC85DRAFT_302460 [Cutaneotrichosporon oleaginosum]|uniref:Uncharacterized protein n=1 Tax=Cutaneotrichosporon oleaginosum TaxID=879819 RepID=A0A0J0XMG0_9TREE|nr:uncharacterized protein CC85DRAFT_302460 [Cutaneotrichosporon oleaginosum]KLT42253.1 hypothetical protein CC85DRAFT_302460 [Cutaneotrichosporon oleaginosum]TXT11425.1 hypothetical protein COLE_01835 [Cutaneotrichosporon oleaginosum]
MAPIKPSSPSSMSRAAPRRRSARLSGAKPATAEHLESASSLVLDPAHPGTIPRRRSPRLSGASAAEPVTALAPARPVRRKAAAVPKAIDEAASPQTHAKSRSSAVTESQAGVAKEVKASEPSDESMNTGGQACEGFSDSQSESDEGTTHAASPPSPGPRSPNHRKSPSPSPRKRALPRKHTPPRHAQPSQIRMRRIRILLARTAGVLGAAAVGLAVYRCLRLHDLATASRALAWKPFRDRN